MTSQTLLALAQQHAQQAQGARADSVVHALLTGESWMNWRVAAAISLVLVALLLVAVFVSEFISIKRSGGLKVYVDNINAVNYGAIRGIWVTEIVIGALSVVVMLRALVPSVVAELQVDALLIVVSAALTMRGINFGAHWIQRKTQDAAVVAANAAAKTPGVMPVVTQNKKTGVTRVDVVTMQSAAPETQTSGTSTTPARAVARYDERTYPTERDD